MNKKINYEKFGIASSITGASLMAIYGISMAIYTSSYAILLDGSFNLISALLTISSMVLVNKISKGYTKRHPLGYYMYEDFIIFTKGIFVLGLIIVSVVSNIKIFLSGGQALNLTGMLIYGIPAIIVNITTCLLCYYSYKKEKTGLLEVEYKTWIINTLITSVVVIAVALVMLLKNTPLKILDRYIDQILVVILSILAISSPIKLIKNSFKQLMLQSASDDYKKPLLNFIKENEVINKSNISINSSDILRMGRITFITMGISSKSNTIDIEEYNSIKSIVSDKAKDLYKDVDLGFIIF